MSDSVPDEVKIPIHHFPGEASEVGPSGVYPDRMEISLLPKKRQIVVTERWYISLVETELMRTRRLKAHRNYIFAENRDEAVKSNYFDRLRTAVLDRWNGSLQLTAVDRKAHHTVTYDVVFRIERAREQNDCHWEVHLNLFDKNYSNGHTDSTDWLTGYIDLHLNSDVMRTIEKNVTQTKRPHSELRSPGSKVHIVGLQMPVAHEFGHTLGLQPGLSTHSDEYFQERYSQEQIRRGVYKSIMNIGNDIDARHADYIVSNLNEYYRQFRSGDPVFSARKATSRHTKK